MIDNTTNRISSLCVLGVVLICSLLAFGFTPSARADAIYTYTGQPFTNFTGGESCTNGVGECFLSGTITFSSPLPPNSTFSDGGSTVPPTLLSFSLTDGVDAFNNQDFCPRCGGIFGVTLVTGSNGQIVNWQFFIAISGVTGLGTTTMDSLPIVGPIGDVTTNGFGGSAFNSGTPGTWTLTTTPEPSSLMLLGIGLLGMAGAWRWKKLKHNP